MVQWLQNGGSDWRRGRRGEGGVCDMVARSGVGEGDVVVARVLQVVVSLFVGGLQFG